jgi:dihydrofolate reductase
MRKIVGGLAISLDASGEYDWLIMDSGFDFVAHMKRFDTFLMGRKTYEKLGAGNAMKGIQSFFVSGTLDKVDKGYSLINGDIAFEVSELKKKKGKDFAVYGGASLLTSLLEYKLVDELMMSVMPIILGKGKRFIGELSARIYPELISANSFSSGVVILSYKIK